MSPIRERIIKIIENLPYDIDKEILDRDAKEILQEITTEYIKLYGIDDLTENDQECIQALIGNNMFKKGK